MEAPHLELSLDSAPCSLLADLNLCLFPVTHCNHVISAFKVSSLCPCRKLLNLRVIFGSLKPVSGVRGEGSLGDPEMHTISLALLSSGTFTHETKSVPQTYPDGPEMRPQCCPHHRCSDFPLPPGKSDSWASTSSLSMHEWTSAH